MKNDFLYYATGLSEPEGQLGIGGPWGHIGSPHYYVPLPPPGFSDLLTALPGTTVFYDVSKKTKTKFAQVFLLQNF